MDTLRGFLTPNPGVSGGFRAITEAAEWRRACENTALYFHDAGFPPADLNPFKIIKRDSGALQQESGRRAPCVLGVSLALGRLWGGV